jgi:pyruvate,water dikinase
MKPPPDRFETRGPVCFGNMMPTAPPTSPPPSEAGGWKGIGCCPGIVRGPVRVIVDPRNALLKAGEILVAERTDPGWIMLFASAAGLLVERGSLLSHSAIVSREMGIPAIVSIPRITRELKDGEWVEMNGSTGTVRRAAHD